MAFLVVLLFSAPIAYFLAWLEIPEIKRESERRIKIIEQTIKDKYFLNEYLSDDK